MNLCKTQFLLTPRPYGGHEIKAYRRKSATLLFSREGKPLRPMTYAEWTEFKRAWPKEVEADGLTLRTVWTLVEVVE